MTPLKLPTWLSGGLRARRTGPRPVLLRICDFEGRPVPKIEIVGVYFPNREALRALRVTDRGGTCIVQWVTGAERMRFTARYGDEVAEVEVLARREDPDRVIDVRLAKPSSP